MNSNPQVRHNIIANFAGKAIAAFFSLAFVPFYIKLMGVEVYGLIGIFMSLSAILSLLDLGLSTTLSRELSRLNSQNENLAQSRNLVRTFEIVYWAGGLFIGLIVYILAPIISHYWLSTSHIDVRLIEKAIMIMGLSIALQWPGSIYTGGLMGLQRQIGVNVIKSVMTMIQHGGAVLLLIYISPSILLFFVWQSVAGFTATIALGVWLWKCLPPSDVSPSFDVQLLIKNRRFASGMTGIAIVTVLLTQADKVILGRMLSLESFGNYVLAFNVANALQNLVTPIFSAVYPKFTQLVAEGDEKRLSDFYHLSCQFLSVVVLPVAICIAAFSREILEVWLGYTTVVEKVAPVLTLLVLGTALNALMTLPYGMQLAYGNTRLALITNLIAISIVIPLMIVLIHFYEGVGAAWAWIILNVGYLIFSIPIMHKKIIKSEMVSWYSLDVLTPLVCTLFVTLACRTIMPADASTFIVISIVVLNLSFSFAIATFFSKHLRQKILPVKGK